MKSSIAYMAGFDAGQASLQWPQRDPRLSGIIDPFTEEIRDRLRFNLLFRPRILIRHMDLFNNLALAKFLTRTSEEEHGDYHGVNLLAETGLLRIAAPEQASIRETFERWAFGGKAQHWHHLNPDEQSEYVAAVNKGSLLKVRLDDLLHMNRHRLTLDVMLTRYEYLFNQRLLPVKLVSSKESWTGLVRRAWEQYLLDREHWSRRPTRGLEALERVVSRGVSEGWRRRDFYSEFDRMRILRGKAAAQEELLLEAKIAVLNAAFYSEFEQGTASLDGKRVQIRAIRDIGLLVPASPLSLQDSNSPAQSVEDDGESISLQPLRHLRLQDVVDFHNGHYPEAKDFQHSIRDLEELTWLTPEQQDSDDIHRRVQKHVHILRRCIERNYQDRKVPYKTEVSGSELLIGVSPDHGKSLYGMMKGLAVASAPVIPLGTLGWIHSIPINACAGILGALITLFLTSKHDSQEHRRFELVLEEKIEDQLRPTEETPVS